MKKAILTAVAIAATFLAATSMATEVDCRDTVPARKAAAVMDKLARGNEGSAGWERLMFDTSTGVVSGKAYVRHRHVWRVAGKKMTAYDNKWTAKFRFDPIHGDGSVKIKFRDGIAISVGELAPALKELKGLFGTPKARSKAPIDSRLQAIAHGFGCLKQAWIELTAQQGVIEDHTAWASQHVASNSGAVNAEAKRFVDAIDALLATRKLSRDDLERIHTLLKAATALAGQGPHPPEGTAEWFREHPSISDECIKSEMRAYLSVLGAL